MLQSLIETMQALGAVGIAALMFLENVIPMIPSEVIMPAAGASARAGQTSLIVIILAGSVGSVLGTLVWYGVARHVGTDRFRDWVGRHGHWLGISPDDVDRMDRWFGRYGTWAVLLGRLVPGVRTLISVPAGIAEMPLTPFLIYTSIGSLAWTAILSLLGYWLKGESQVAANVISWIGVLVIAGLLVWFVMRIVETKVDRSRSSR